MVNVWRFSFDKAVGCDVLLIILSFRVHVRSTSHDVIKNDKIEFTYFKLEEINHFSNL